MKIYRVLARVTSSVQQRWGATTWVSEVLYCGNDIDEARLAYHSSTPEDFGGWPGSRCRQTVAEVIDPADSDDLDEDRVSTVEL